MTQNEFETRAKIEVTAKEFDSINEVYMNCDLDKDEFCKMWVKMNKSRIAKFAAQKNEEAQKAADMEAAYDLYTRLMNVTDFTLAVSHLNDEEEGFIKRVGIKLREWDSWHGCELFRSATSVGYDLGIFCGAIQQRAW